MLDAKRVRDMHAQRQQEGSDANATPRGRPETLMAIKKNGEKRWQKKGAASSLRRNNKGKKSPTSTRAKQLRVSNKNQVFRRGVGVQRVRAARARAFCDLFKSAGRGVAASGPAPPPVGLKADNASGKECGGGGGVVKAKFFRGEIRAKESKPAAHPRPDAFFFRCKGMGEGQERAFGGQQKQRLAKKCAAGAEVSQ